MTSGTAHASCQATRGGRSKSGWPWRIFFLLGLLSMADRLSGQPALAQPAEPTTRTEAGQPGPASRDPGVQPRQGGGGVLVPPDHVDPGMTRPVPEMPAQSTPVIRPRQLHRNRHGTELVVPK